jgi:uncharacterized protein
MAGETDLQKLLAALNPELNAGEFVYCQVDSREAAASLEPICIFLEQEGITVILPRVRADKMGFSYPMVCAWITLTVHSSLEGVGLTAAVSRALAEANISCNVVAAWHHDHLFVPLKDAERAMDVLRSLSKEN